MLLDVFKSVGLLSETPGVVMDSEVNNVNGEANGLISSEVIHCLLTMVAIDFSNSMFEAHRCSAKHQWLNLHELRTLADARRLLGFLAAWHNNTPHSAFVGSAPNEIYAGVGGAITEMIRAKRVTALRVRVETNWAIGCRQCPKLV